MKTRIYHSIEKTCLILASSVVFKRHFTGWVWDGYRVRAGHGTTGPVVCQKQPPRGDQEVSGVFGKRGEGAFR